MKRQIKHKLLIFYGYILSIIGALSVASIPLVLNFDAYINVISVFQDNIALILGVMAFFSAISFPFQVKVIAEDSESILKILEHTEVRNVFKDALYYQAVTNIISGIFLLVGSTIFPNKHWVGFLLLFCASFVGFESLCMISNGIAYANLREKILLKIDKDNNFIERNNVN